MAEKTNRDLVMSFDRADGKNHNITIPDYREDITDAEVKTGGQTIVADGIFEPEGAPLTAWTGAVKVVTTKTDVPAE